MFRAPDTRFATDWVARFGQGLVALACVMASPAYAQILGEGAPGMPGLIQGELRPARPPNTPILVEPPYRAAESPIPDRPSKQNLKRNPNSAIRRNLPPGQQGRPPISVPPTGFGAGPSTMTGPAARALPALRSAPPPPTAPGLPVLPPPSPRKPQQDNDPYAPLGIRAGGMIYRPALEVSGGYHTNPAGASKSPKGSPTYRTEAELKATSEWSRHSLNLDLRGSYSGFTSFENINRPEGDVRAALRLDATKDLQFEIEGRSRIETESATSVNLPGGISGRTPFYTNTATLGATQRFDRLSLGIRGTLERVDYADAQTTAGGTLDQTSRNLTSYGLRLRSGFEITPGFAPFLEAGVDARKHDTRLDGGGYARDSVGSILRLGTTLELARDLTGEAAVGYAIRDYEDKRLKTLHAPTLDAALTWSMSPLTTLGLKAQTELQETTTAGSSGAIAYRGTATLTHAFRRNFTATGTLGLARSDYDKTRRQETTVTAGLRLEYKIDRNWAVRGSYVYETLKVNTPGENTSSHILLLGVRVTP